MAKNQTHFKYKRPCIISTAESCRGKRYGWKKKCMFCPEGEKCVEEWSEKIWNTHRASGYGRGYDDDAED